MALTVGLIDVDGHNFPNLALMRISAWHKAQGDLVEWYQPPMFRAMYDIVYMSKVFSDAYSPDIDEPLKMLPNGTFVVSYADTAWSHVGYIYQATNFLYTGLSAKRNDVYQPGGLHPRAYNKDDHSELMQSRSQKHRYIYLVGTKTQKKRMRKQLKYKVYDHYPKGEETHYNIEDPKPIKKIEIIERKKPQVKRRSNNETQEATHSAEAEG